MCCQRINDPSFYMYQVQCPVPEWYKQFLVVLTRCGASEKKYLKRRRAFQCTVAVISLGTPIHGFVEAIKSSIWKGTIWCSSNNPQITTCLKYAYCRSEERHQLCSSNWSCRKMGQTELQLYMPHGLKMPDMTSLGRQKKYPNELTVIWNHLWLIINWNTVTHFAGRGVADIA